MAKQPHIQLDSTLNAVKAIIVGDPNRVSMVKDFLEDAEELVFNREYRSIIGYYHGEKILVLSTGIGAPSAAIAIEELCLIGITEIIRVGSCGAMQEGFDLGEIMVVTGVVRDEGLTKNYVPTSFPAIPDTDLLFSAVSQKEIPFKKGIARSHDGFYHDDNAKTEKYWSQKNVLGADMESGALYTLGQLRKIKVLSILNNVVIYNESLQEGVNQLVSGEDKVATGEINSILLALHTLTRGN